MRTSASTALATVLLGASAASAQLSTASIIKTVSSFVSTECLTAIEGVISPNSTTGQCLQTGLIASALNDTGSIIPDVDSYLTSFCASQPCSNETLQNASQTIISSCASDLTKFGASFGLTNQTIELFFDVQPLAREVLCLKTSDPYNSANASIPINSTVYNSTNGTFCATSLLTEVSSYLGSNLTLNYIETVALGGNASALNTLKAIPKTALCSDCIFAGLDLIEQEFPSLGNTTVGNYTLNTFIDGTCSASGLQVSSNGTIPANITESAFNSSYPYNVTNGNTTYIATSTATPSTANISSIIGNLTNSANTTGVTSIAASVTSSLLSQSTASGNTTALKKRWIGA